jgi:hypothetical protein
MLPMVAGKCMSTTAVSAHAAHHAGAVQHINGTIGWNSKSSGTRLLVLVFGYGDCCYVLASAAWYVKWQQHCSRKSMQPAGWRPSHPCMQGYSYMQGCVCTHGWLDPGLSSTRRTHQNPESIRFAGAGSPAFRNQKATGLLRRPSRNQHIVCV